MLQITVDSSTIGEALERLQAAAGDLTPAMIDIAATLWERVGERFERQADPLGAGWADWSPATVASYPTDGNHRILDRSGHMLMSLDREAGPDFARVGFGQPYAAYHEFGTERMPRRGLLFADPEAGTLAPEDEQAVLERIEEHLRNAHGA